MTEKLHVFYTLEMTNNVLRNLWQKNYFVQLSNACTFQESLLLEF